jgi:hypothetical protein
MVIIVNRPRFPDGHCLPLRLLIAGQASGTPRVGSPPTHRTSMKESSNDRLGPFLTSQTDAVLGVGSPLIKKTAILVSLVEPQTYIGCRFAGNVGSGFRCQFAKKCIRFGVWPT